MNNGTRGLKSAGDVRNYATPQGPKHQMDSGPGLHSNNYGNCGTQGKHGVMAETSGKVGLGGERMSNAGTQGKR